MPRNSITNKKIIWWPLGVLPFDNEQKKDLMATRCNSCWKGITNNSMATRLTSNGLRVEMAPNGYQVQFFPKRNNTNNPMATRLPSNGLWVEKTQLAWTIVSWGIELVNLTKPSFEFHVIIGNGTNVLQRVMVTNL